MPSSLMSAELLSQIREMNSRSEAHTTSAVSLGSATQSQAAKLSKKKKRAIFNMDQMVLSRISDYFTCWKLKVLLGQNLPAEQ